MGIIRHHILLLLLAVSLHACSLAQGLPEVHKINGNKYYLHVVEPGNTLYGISKLYNVPIEDIDRDNPGVIKDGLKVNQTLLIPVTSDNKRSLGAVVQQSAEFITHQVQPKETLYSISKQYNVSLDDLLEANPVIQEEGLKANATVSIPVSKVETNTPSTVVGARPDSLKAHRVVKGETLYGISKQYGVEIETLKAANPLLKEEGLKVGMAIRIPGTSVPTVAAPNDTTKSKETGKNDSLVVVKPSVDSAQQSFTIAMVLPIEPSFPDSITSLQDFRISEAQRVSLSFYRGFVHAIDSLNARYPVTLHLKLLSSGQDTSALRNLALTGSLNEVDLVVGPFYTAQFEWLADYLKPKGVPVICPIPKPSKILFNRPNAIKTTPSESMQLDAMAAFLAKTYRDSNLVVINSNKLPDQDQIEFFKSRFGVALNVPDTFVQDAVREVKLWDITREALTMRFPDSGSYALVVPSKNKVFVTRLLGQLYNLQYESEGMYRFRVFGLEEWEKYDADLDIQQLHSLRVTIPIDGYLDFSDYRIRQYYRQYRAAYGFEPNEFTLKGFDLSHYLLQQLSTHPVSWFQSPEDFSHDGLLSDYHFQRVIPPSGIENQGVVLYEYKSFRLNKFAQWPEARKK